jgi:hypothetical protein
MLLMEAADAGAATNSGANKAASIPTIVSMLNRLCDMVVRESRVMIMRSFDEANMNNKKPVLLTLE